MGDPDSALSRVFDVLVLGTGLTEALVAAAAAKAGKSVLHVDAEDFYGGSHAALPLSQFIEVARQAQPTTGSENPTPSLQLPAATKQIARLDPHAQSTIRFHGTDPLPPAIAPGAARRVVVDLLPTLLLARGAPVDAVVDSGAANYLEFKTVEAAYIAEERASDGAPLPWALRLLPSSKADVFSAPGLGLLDKRRLMRFLQWALDYAHAAESAGSGGGDVTSLNEVALGTGRSLLRPQNKGPLASPQAHAQGQEQLSSPQPPDATVASADAGSTSAAALSSFEAALRCPSGDDAFSQWAGRPFAAFLAGPCDLPRSLRELAIHAIAMVPAAQEGTEGGLLQGQGGVVSAREGMTRLSHYLRALGRFPGAGTPFIVAMYGVSRSRCPLHMHTPPEPVSDLQLVTLRHPPALSLSFPSLPVCPVLPSCSRGSSLRLCAALPPCTGPSTCCALHPWHCWRARKPGWTRSTRSGRGARKRGKRVSARLQHRMMVLTQRLRQLMHRPLCPCQLMPRPYSTIALSWQWASLPARGSCCGRGPSSVTALT